jgi:hypothetical protein
MWMIDAIGEGDWWAKKELDVCGYAQPRGSLTVTALQMASRLSRVRSTMHKTSWLAATAVKGTTTTTVMLSNDPPAPQSHRSWNDALQRPGNNLDWGMRGTAS